MKQCRADRRIVAIAAPLWLLAAGCEDGSGDGSETAPGRTASADSALHGAVLILLDTVRADHLSSYGYPRPTSPNLDALAAKGVRFEQVVAPSPWTLPSVGALLSGEYANRGFAAEWKLSWSIVEPIERAGFATAAITEGGYLSSTFGLDRSFEHYVEEEGAVGLDQPRERGGGGIENTFRLAREWLVEHQDQPFFLFIHTYEPHIPYTRHAFTAGMDPGAVGSEFAIELLARVEAGRVVLTNSEIEYVKSLYDGGILEADEYVGSFLALFRELGLEDRTLVVVTSDHGEELDDHYRPFTGDHGHSLRDPLLMVPLIIVDPRERDLAREVSAQVRLVDIMPTIAESLGVEIDRPIDGKSLVPLMTGAETEDRLAFSGLTQNGPGRASIRQHGFKYIETLAPDINRPRLRPSPPARQLYDLTADPLEQRNLIESRPELARSMGAALDAVIEAFYEPGEFVRPDVADPALVERLESLGYLGD